MNILMTIILELPIIFLIIGIIFLVSEDIYEDFNNYNYNCNSIIEQIVFIYMKFFVILGCFVGIVGIVWGSL